MEGGKLFHQLLSQYFTTPDQIKIDGSVEGVWSSVSSVLKNIGSAKAIESHVVHPVLKYRGIIDCIATYE